ncbi:MAG: hypothetical protein HQ511_07210 [Rhodospirillales bacterium]|nr:hypothetical protein [Rhodospirillales bacterium]
MTVKGTLATLLLASFLCAGCVSSPTTLLLDSNVGLDLSYRKFDVCKDYGCATIVPVALTPDEWTQITQIFTIPAPDPAAERRLIANAVGLFERLVGPKAGTDVDAAGAALLKVGKQGQQDCIDESFNTSTYLMLLDWNGFLHWHQAGEPARRGKFIDLEWPHNTATVVERLTGDRYAVDSWFHKNGQKPEIVPVDLWLGGWRPVGA